MNLQKLSFEMAAFTLLVVILANLINENPTPSNVVFLLLVFGIAGWEVVSVVANHIFDEKEGEEKKE